MYSKVQWCISVLCKTIVRHVTRVKILAQTFNEKKETNVHLPSNGNVDKTRNMEHSVLDLTPDCNSGLISIPLGLFLRGNFG